MILDGKALSKRIKAELTEQTAAFTAETGIVPCLATVLVGEDPASAVYVRSKRRSCKKIGYESRHHHLDAGITQEALLQLVEDLTISNNQSLLQLEGLGGLDQVSGDLTLSDNPSLESLSGLHNLTEVGGSLSLSTLYSLRTMEGLGLLHSSRSLSIENNPALVDLRDLQDLTRVLDTLTVRDNACLAEGEINWLVEELSKVIEPTVTVTGNGTGTSCE